MRTETTHPTQCRLRRRGPSALRTAVWTVILGSTGSRTAIAQITDAGRVSTSSMSWSTSTPNTNRLDAGGSSSITPMQVRERILGWDAARSTVTYVEVMPSGIAGFSHVTLVDLGRDAGSDRRVRLTTETDAAQVRAATDRNVVRQTIEMRVERDIAAAAARLQAGGVVPMSPRAAVRGCVRAPYAATDFDSGGGLRVHIEPAADGMRALANLFEQNRAGAPSEVPSMIVSSGGQSLHAPYNRVMDLRQIPGTDQYVALLASDACTPEGVRVPARAVLLAAPPPPERPLQPLVHAELNEFVAIRAVAPRARRRSVDGLSGYFDGAQRVVFDNAWAIPGAPDRVLVQFSRHDEHMPTDIADRGQARATFAVIERRGENNLRVLSTLSPPASEDVFEGVGQEAYSIDLDGDGTSEIVVRSRFNPGGEVATVLRYAAEHVEFVWHALISNDTRDVAASAGLASEVRRCNVGEDQRTLVLRCSVERYAAGTARGATPASREQVITRMRWNGGSANVTTERR